MKRRQFVQTVGAAAVLGPLGLSARADTSRNLNKQCCSARVVVIGGGYGGATAAKYVRMWSDNAIDVTLIEANPNFVSGPLSNLVLGGSKTLADLTVPYDKLVSRHGVRVLHDTVVRINPERKFVKLRSGNEVEYDRLILSPGVDFMWDSLPGMNISGVQDRILHAWKPGPQTLALRKQLEDMPDGGVFAMSIPLAPYRCPPGPYERACQVASYLAQAKPKSKVLILDANDDVTSKPVLFKQAWAERYAGIIEYLPRHNTIDIDPATKTFKFEASDDVKADVMNVLPAMRAGDIATQTGLANINQRWCEVDFLTHESKVAPHIHILGDAVQAASAMPKSGHMANQHGKTCAAAVVALLTGKEVNPLPLYNNTCYSFVSADEAIHVASVHRYDAAQKTMLTVPGSGGLSAAASVQEGQYAQAWARNIWADTLA